MQDSVFNRRALLAGGSITLGGLFLLFATRGAPDSPETGVVRIAQSEVPFAAQVMPWDESAYEVINADGPTLMLL